MKYSILTLFALLCTSVPLFGQDEKPDIDSGASREMIRQWVQAERLLSEEKNAWKVEKQRMQDLLDIYEKELKLLNDEIGKAGASAELADDRKVKLESELREYKESQQLLSDTLSRLVPRARVLITQLPEPLHEELVEDIDILNAEDALAKPREVLKSMLSILAGAGRFNRTITVVEETRVLADKSKVSVDVMYLGLARSYYTSSAGDTAGIGSPGKDGWKWEEKPGIAGDVRRAIAVYNKDKQPQLIELPVGVRSSK